ncbi:hypothetical protein Tco_1426266, partial [Tanacetum coccineum]
MWSHSIIDFLKASYVHYALTVNPIIYTSCIEQFWITAKSSIKRDLHLDDAEGTDCLPTDTIFEELAREDSDHLTDSTPIHILDQPSSSSQPKKDKPSKKAQRQEAEVLDSLKKRIQRLEKKKISRPTGLKRLRKIGMNRRVESSKDQESLGAPEDASKQGRSIKDIDIYADVDVSLVNETQERQDDDLILDTGVLEDDEMHVEAKVNEKEEHSTKPDDSTASKEVTTASVDDS